MGEWEEGGTSVGGGKLTQERMIDAVATKVTAKKETEKLSNADKDKVDE